MEDKFYTIDEIAEMLGMHHKTIRKFIREGKLGANKVGKQWRISGHELSVFMEKNNVNISNKKIDDEDSMEFSATDEKLHNTKGKINVSTVVEVNEVNFDEHARISNTLIALMNCKDPDMGNSTINVKYYENEKKLRVILWGSIKFMEEMLNLISMLVEQTKMQL